MELISSSECDDVFKQIKSLILYKYEICMNSNKKAKRD